MTKKLSLILPLLAGLVIGLALTWPREAPPPGLPALAADATILAFGDSLTYGNGVGQDAAFPQLLADMSGRRVVTVANPGDQTRAARRMLPAVLDSVAPDLLVLGSGTMDFLREVEPDEVRDNLKAMIAAARERDIPVLLIGVPMTGSPALGAHPLYAELGAEPGVVLEARALATILNQAELRYDPVHPNAEGHRRLARALMELMRQRGAL